MWVRNSMGLHRNSSPFFYDDWVAPMDGDAGQFNWSHISEAVILVVSWAWFFSRSHLRGWNIQGGFFISISGAWGRMAGAAWAAWSFLSCQMAFLHVAGLPHRMAVLDQQTYLTVGFSHIECSKNRGGAAWLPGPSLRSSQTLLANYVTASSGSTGWETHSTFFDGRRSKESVVIFGPSQASYWLILLGTRLLAEMPVGPIWPQIYLKQCLANFF